MQNRKENHFDAIVIGSGLGGLTTAGLLSKLNKKRVLVLERHYELGGLTHEFKRGPYSWDVGLHYVGNMNVRLFDQIGKFLFNFLTNGRLKWNKMPQIFEKYFFPGLTIEVSESVKSYKKELIKHFPHQKKAIKKYLTDVQLARFWFLANFFSRFLHPPFAQIFKLLRIINRKKALMTTGEYLNKYIGDKKLRAVLVSRWGNYGIPPLESVFAVNALIEHHYYNGGSFPDGGAEKIGSYMEETIDTTGGTILINREVTEIIVEKNKAIGVRSVNLAEPDKKVTEYYAPIIISDAGLQNTYLKLLPRNLNLPLQNKLLDFFPGYSGLDVYLGLKDSPEKLGIKGENCWIVDSFELDLFGKKEKNILEGNVCYCFLSFPSLKNGKHGGHTADIVTIFPYEVFKKWDDTYWKERSNKYYEFKEKLIENLLKLVDKYIPGFSELVIYKEMASPLTFKHFTGQKSGNFYGLPAIPERYKIKEINVKTPIKGLYITGADLICNGIVPALFSGMATASNINGFFGFFIIMIKVVLFRPSKKRSKSEHTQLHSFHTLSEDKMSAVLVEKKQKSKEMIELSYRFERPIHFIPGQHIKLLVAEAEWRAYSVARADKNHLSLIIDTRPGGFGSNYAEKIKLKQRSIFRMPLTDLIYHKTTKDLIFIASGTGLVPFLHILDELMQKKIKHKVIIIFGSLKENSKFVDDYLKPYEEYFDMDKHYCVEEPKPKSPYFKGRVTDFLENSKYNFNDYDFYVCGHPHMTQAVMKYLRDKGVNRIYW